MSGTKRKTLESSYQKYIIKKHSGFNTPHQLVKKAVVKATGSILIKKTRIVEGEINEVYDVLTKDGINVIVRISRSDDPSFEAEQKAIELALNAGVPAPKVLLIDKVLTEDKQLTFCIEEKLEGVPLKLLMKTSEKKDLKPLITEAGEILSKIHSVKVESFGNLKNNLQHKTWGDFIFHLEHIKEKIIDSAKKADISSILINETFLLLRKYDEMFQLNQAKLLHGDFSPKHLLVKDNHIVGIIDFENAKGGDPIRDIAWVNYFYGESFSIEYLKLGYSDKSIFDNNFDLKMKLYRLHLSLDLINYYGTENNEAGMNLSKDRLLRELKGFSIT